jgi:hypothetical protein
MIEAGEVGAVFTVVDEASVVLQRLARQFKELDGLVLKTKESLKALGCEFRRNPAGDSDLKPATVPI